MDYVDLLELLDGVQSGQLGVDPADFALHLQSYRGRFVNLLRYKVLLQGGGRREGGAPWVAPPSII